MALDHLSKNISSGSGNSFFRLVPLVIPGIAGGNTGTQFTFPDIGDLRYARTVALEVFFAKALAVCQPSLTPVVPDSQANLITFIFNSNDPDKADAQQGENGRFNTTIDSQRWLPATAINRVQTTDTSGAPFVRQLMRFKDLYIVWDKSMVQLAPGGLANTTDLAVVLGVHYTFINLRGEAYKRT